jgi:hypothetical protein
MRGLSVLRGSVELVVYAHSIDFGAKGYGNLVELASLQHHELSASWRVRRV